MSMVDKICSIYRCTNILNGKVYIGFTTDLKKRISVHLSSSKKEDTKFYRAIRKYGKDNFVWEVIYQSLDFDHCLNIMEGYFITLYDSYKRGYNSTTGGDGAKGMVLSEEARRRISEGNKVPKPGSGVYERTDEHRRILAESRKLVPPMSEESRLAISKRLKGKPKTPQHLEAMSRRWQDNTTVKCPYCSKEGDYKNMKRWHFDKCKCNPSYVDTTKEVVCEHCGFSAKESPNFYKNHGTHCRSVNQ